MSDGDSGSNDTSGDTDSWGAAAEPASGSTARIAEPVPRSRLVGLMAEPVSRSVPLRRSTLLMLVAFLGFGTLNYFYPPNGSTSSTPAGSAGIQGTFVPLTTTPPPYPTSTTTTASRPGLPEATTTTTTTTTTRPTSTTVTTTTGTPVTSTPTSTSTSSTTTLPTANSTTTTTTAP